MLTGLYLDVIIGDLRNERSPNRTVSIRPPFAAGPVGDHRNPVAEKRDSTPRPKAFRVDGQPGIERDVDLSLYFRPERFRKKHGKCRARAIGACGAPLDKDLD